MIVEGRGGAILDTRADLIVAPVDGGETFPLGPLSSILAGREEEGTIRRILVSCDEIDEAAFWEMPGLHV